MTNVEESLIKADTSKLSFKKRSLWKQKLRAGTLLASAGLGYGKAALFLLSVLPGKFPGCLWWRAGKRRVGQLTLAEYQRNKSDPLKKRKKKRKKCIRSPTGDEKSSLPCPPPLAKKAPQNKKNTLVSGKLTTGEI